MIDLDELLAAHDGVLLASQHRSRRNSLSRWCVAGRLRRVLPGTYIHPAADLATRLRALAARVPDAVVRGPAAAAIEAGHDIETIDVATRSRRRGWPGFRFLRRKVPLEDRMPLGDIALDSPVSRAIEAAATDRGALVDELLRARFSLDTLGACLDRCPRRRGNRTRRRVLRRSRSRPSSQAEREYHDLFDRFGITGWTANHEVVLSGRRYLLDIAFVGLGVAIEIDGYAHHSSHAAFEADRHRQNALVVAGWVVLRLTWSMLSDPEAVVRLVKQAVHRAVRRRSPAAG